MSTKIVAMGMGTHSGQKVSWLPGRAINPGRTHIGPWHLEEVPEDRHVVRGRREKGRFWTVAL